MLALCLEETTDSESDPRDPGLWLMELVLDPLGLVTTLLLLSSSRLSPLPILSNNALALENLSWWDSVLCTVTLLALLTSLVTLLLLLLETLVPGNTCLPAAVVSVSGLRWWATDGATTGALLWPESCVCWVWNMLAIWATLEEVATPPPEPELRIFNCIRCLKINKTVVLPEIISYYKVCQFGEISLFVQRCSWLTRTRRKTWDVDTKRVFMFRFNFLSTTLLFLGAWIWRCSLVEFDVSCDGDFHTIIVAEQSQELIRHFISGLQTQERLVSVSGSGSN